MTKNSYWSQNGNYQKESEYLSSLVPATGESFDTRVELFRCATNVYYDIFNNGGCNLDSPLIDELRFLQSKVDTKLLDEFLEVYQDEQDNWDYIDRDNLESDKMFESVCDFMDSIMDKVIENIKSTGFEFKEVVKN